VATAFIGVGSNIDPERNVEDALRMLAKHVTITGVSTFYRTEAISRPDDPSYFNGVVRIETGLSPSDLRRGVLREIENALGRRRGGDKYAARTIDLDIVMYADLVQDDGDLVLPDPDILKREFLSVPLSELDPEMPLPGSGARMKDIAARADAGAMRPLEEYTRELRRKIGHGLRKG
jgi:2-amino-4-hydroxy-6-hydroxymethyldihydropteridine diphosphokinase